MLLVAASLIRPEAWPFLGGYAIWQWVKQPEVWPSRALLILGLLVLAYMSSGSMVKALAMATLGLLLGMIGIDQMTGYFRFAYGVVELGDGIGVVPVAVGLFGLSEILATAGQETPPAVIKPTLRELLPSRQEWKDANWPIWRGTVLGFLIGIIPGSAHIISSFVSYAVERRLARRPEEFGQGAVAGVAGPESANNSATSGARRCSRSIHRGRNERCRVRGIRNRSTPNWVT